MLLMAVVKGMISIGRNLPLDPVSEFQQYKFQDKYGARLTIGQGDQMA